MVVNRGPGRFGNKPKMAFETVTRISERTINPIPRRGSVGTPTAGSASPVLSPYLASPEALAQGPAWQR